MKRIAIIGGGISGLSAAFTLEQQRAAGVQLEYILFESSPRLGGVLFTERVEKCLIEAGPDSFLTEKPWASDLCHQLGLSDQLIGSNDSERKTYILVKGRLQPIPDGLVFLVPTRILPTIFSPLFSFGTKLRMAREWFHRPRPSQADETVAALIERHYGSEVVDRLADPMLSGVYGGEASQLSVCAVLPRFAEMEAKYGSLGKGMLAAKRAASQTAQSAAKPIFTSLKNGMQQMVDALLARLPATAFRLNTPVRALRRDEGWLVSTEHGSNRFDAVILAASAAIAASLLGETSAEIASELAAITYTSSVTVALVYGPGVRSGLPAGFGFLVPRSEGKRMLACTFVHNKFLNRAPEDRGLLRCFLGGARDEAVLQLSDDEILKIVRFELSEILGISTEPLAARVYKWKSAMAQYNVGHLDRLQRIDRLRLQLPGLSLAGNAYCGIGVPDCIRSGQQAAAEVMNTLGSV